MCGVSGVDKCTIHALGFIIAEQISRGENRVPSGCEGDVTFFVRGVAVDRDGGLESDDLSESQILGSQGLDVVQECGTRDGRVIYAV